ncbi:HU family DNA-binding protein [Candidatus Uhrbacteria bacterium]|nr:HU family DNA-binding protein [Candidatus Uhrbacteria bacterium]
MAKMTKAQIIRELADKSGHSKKDIETLLDMLTTLAYKQVKSSGEFLVPGFGKMVKMQRKARQGRNPATGQTITIPAKTVVKFRLAKAAKEAVL